MGKKGQQADKPATGESDKCTEGTNSGLVSVSETLNKVKIELELTYGYLLRPEIGGAFCGHTVYKRENKIPIPGIKAPDTFWYWRTIKPNEATGFYAAIKEICEDLMGSCASDHIQVYKNIALCFLDNSVDPKSAVAKIAQTSYGNQARLGLGRTVTLNGSNGHFKVVPLVSWFPEALQEFNARGLLTLFPDAEARQLMLILGRTVVGATETRCAEGDIEHTARSYAIIVGQQAGLGKSTQSNYINKALSNLGYSVSNAHINETKFGWGTIAQSDLAFIDDLTDDVQKRLLSDVRIKSIVSNNTLKVEEKGQPACDVRATTTILGCTNMHSYAHYIGMDSGSISRVNQLDTYTRAEMEERYPEIPDPRVKPHWETLAKKFKCSTECLAAYLLRRSADYFLEVCGYVWDDGRLFKDDEDRLEEVTKANRKDFRIDTSLKHAEELVSAVGHLVALSIADSSNSRRRAYEELLQYLDFSPGLVLAVMRMFSVIKQSTRLPSEYAALDLPNASWDAKEYISKKLADFDRLGTVKTSEDSFGVLMKEMKSNKGFGYPLRSSHYMPEWQAVKRLIPKWVKKYEEVISTIDPPKGVQVAIAEVHKLFTDLG
ncbi:MAG: hypothetical protein KME59_21505 [Trichormus sp. ATA11-4-KO1]|jgi:hypothetical protein|nr:hypothetical protein [Trichormus sp. ATA11-4-KO1]